MPVYIPTNSGHGFLAPHIFTRICNHLYSSCWSFWVICDGISLSSQGMIVNTFFQKNYWLIVCISSFENSMFASKAHFLLGCLGFDVYVSLFFGLGSSLHFLDINPLLGYIAGKDFLLIWKLPWHLIERLVCYIETFIFLEKSHTSYTVNTDHVHSPLSLSNSP